MDVRQVVLVLSATVLVLEKIAMTQPIFDDERLDVDRLTIDYSAVDDVSNLCGDSDLRTIVSLLTRWIQRNTADASDAIEYERTDSRIVGARLSEILIGDGIRHPEFPCVCRVSGPKVRSFQ